MSPVEDGHPTNGQRGSNVTTMTITGGDTCTTCDPIDSGVGAVDVGGTGHEERGVPAIGVAVDGQGMRAGVCGGGDVSIASSTSGGLPIHCDSGKKSEPDGGGDRDAVDKAACGDGFCTQHFHCRHNHYHLDYGSVAVRTGSARHHASSMRVIW